MITQSSLNNTLCHGRDTADCLAKRYTQAVTYGQKDEKELKNKWLAAELFIWVIEKYDPTPSKPVKEFQILTTDDTGAPLTNGDNFLSLGKGTDTQIDLDPDDFNCLSESDLCRVIANLKKLC